MQKRYVAIWFRHLKTDWMIRQQPNLKEVPFVLQLPDHGRMQITEVSANAKAAGIERGMTVADARVIVPGIQVIDDKPELSQKLLIKLCDWCIRYTPFVSVDPPDGLLLDATGCAHLWGSEKDYLKSILTKLKGFGYSVRIAMADTAGAAWAVARYGKVKAIIASDEQADAIMPLPPAALRIHASVQERLYKLGLYEVKSFMNMPRSVLRRRFGEALLLQLDYALGTKEETLQPLQPDQPYFERLPCVEPVATRKGIEIALQTLLDTLSHRLQKEGKGLRSAFFKAYRVDDKVEEISIGTNHPSCNKNHLFHLFEEKIESIEPALGIELFTLSAQKTEDLIVVQDTFWNKTASLQNKDLSELLDGLQSRFGSNTIHRYLPAEHYLPERSIQLSASLSEQPATAWSLDKWRPIQLLQKPEPIQVTAPIPDYPPMNFRYKGKLHSVTKADACERIEPEWWLDGGLHRDYYIVEDEEGKRYWLFRLGHYNADTIPPWFIHGFFE